MLRYKLLEEVLTWEWRSVYSWEQCEVRLGSYGVTSVEGAFVLIRASGIYDQKR